MNAEPSDLEQQLAELTRWKGRPTALWREAMRRASKQKSTPLLLALFQKYPKTAVAALACCGVVLSAAVITASMSRPAATPGRLNTPSEMRARRGVAVADKARHTPLATESPEARRSTGAPSPSADTWTVARSPGDAVKQFESAPTTDTVERHVVRKATIELRCADVRTAFLKAQQIVQAGHGEFVENSALTGAGDHTHGTLTLRVAAERLSEVLQALRDLGEVANEQQDGEDVTGQVVDVEARLRNERRVEAELLELLEGRKDAPLKDVLELRTALSDVRGEIERLDGQLAYLSRLVRLATVLVIITPDDDSQGSPDHAFGAYLGHRIAQAWKRGTLFLADTLATIVSILVGGAVWWIVIVLVLYLVFRRMPRTKNDR